MEHGGFRVKKNDRMGISIRNPTLPSSAAGYIGKHFSSCTDSHLNSICPTSVRFSMTLVQLQTYDSVSVTGAKVGIHRAQTKAPFAESYFLGNVWF